MTGAVKVTSGEETTGEEMSGDETVGEENFGEETAAAEFSWCTGIGAVCVDGCSLSSSDSSCE